MAHARPSGQPEARLAPPPTDRRHFLHTGVVCLVPLLAGTTLGRAASAWPIARPAQAPDTDAIVNHLNRELLKVCQGMQGMEGVKGEHVRALAANLDLMAAHMVEKGHQHRLEAKLKEAVGRSGRDGFAQELFMRQAEAIAATAEEHGIANRVRLDLLETGVALDVARRQGFVTVFQRTAPALHRLAAAMDGARQRQGDVRRAADQKPGDDFFGYNLQPEPQLTCKDLRFLIHFMAIGGGILGLVGLGISGIICALIAEALSMLYDMVCSGAEAFA